ncbi:MAG TPA: hypothetical protein VFU02_11775, partial [Polyangiaceae bacterium]|nr:hypothetical protein [Polyangiaceae bacterium]
MRRFAVTPTPMLSIVRNPAIRQTSKRFLRPATRGEPGSSRGRQLTHLAFALVTLACAESGSDSNAAGATASNAGGSNGSTGGSGNASSSADAGAGGSGVTTAGGGGSAGGDNSAGAAGGSSAGGNSVGGNSAGGSDASTPTTATGAGGHAGVESGTAGAAGASGAAADCVPFEMRGDCAAASDGPLPAELRCTGLYADWEARTLRCDVRAYAPAYELWSDAASKQRYVYLPPETSIDVTNPDSFEYPVGTQFWKEFWLPGDEPGVVGETRLMRKTAGGWLYTSYVWSEDGSTALQTNT